MTTGDGWREERRAERADTESCALRGLTAEQTSLPLASRTDRPPQSMKPHHPHELVPRPEQTPDALRAALAVVAPGRLQEMRRTQDEAFALAVTWRSVSPVLSWVLVWARDIEIARRADLSVRLARANGELEAEDPAVARDALHELTAVLDEAMETVRR